MPSNDSDRLTFLCSQCGDTTSCSMGIPRTVCTSCMMAEFWDTQHRRERAVVNPRELSCSDCGSMYPQGSFSEVDFLCRTCEYKKMWKSAARHCLDGPAIVFPNQPNPFQ